MQNPDHPGIGAQVDKIRAEIRQHGESRVGCEELTLLCRNEVSDAQQLREKRPGGGGGTWEYKLKGGIFK